MRESSGPVHTPASPSQASLDALSAGTHPGGQAQRPGSQLPGHAMYGTLARIARLSVTEIPMCAPSRWDPGKGQDRRGCW